MTRIAPCALAVLALTLACGFDTKVDLGAGETEIPGPGPDGGEPGGSGGDDSGPVPEPEGCGNGDIDGDESCDDGNQAGGDGCSASCAIEPGFVCDDSGCTEVASLSVGPPHHPAGVSFGLGDVETSDCPQGYLVGFAGETNQTLGLQGIRGICADLEVEGGELDWEESSMTDLLGSESMSLVASVCERDELLIGLRVHHTGVEIEGVAPVCATAVVVDGQLTLGEGQARERIGGAGLANLDALCDPGAVAADRVAADSDPTGLGALGIRCGGPELDSE